MFVTRGGDTFGACRARDGFNRAGGDAMGGNRMKPILSPQDIAAASMACPAGDRLGGLDPDVCDAAHPVRRSSITILIGGSRRPPRAASAIAIQPFKSRHRSNSPGFAPCLGQCRP